MSKNSVAEILENNKEELFRLRKEGYLVKDIALKFGLNTSTLSGFYLRNNVLVRHPLTEDEKKEILRRYLNGETPKMICKDFHVTSARIPEVVKEMGYTPRDRSSSKRIYSINDHYFDKIDSQNKAYIIGLLIADGNRSKSGYAINLSLQEKDVDILKKINIELENERPLKFVELSKKNPNYSNQYLLSFNSPRICKVLETYGIVPNKDFLTFFPRDIDESMYRHVIRGILDGDGSICKTEARCNITGNRVLLEFIKEYIEKALNVHFTIYIPHKDKKGDTETRTIQIAGSRQVKLFLDYLYNDSILYIKRKYDVYQSKYGNNSIPSCA